MFRSANSLISKKYGNLLRSENKNLEIEKYFKEFLVEEFGTKAPKIAYKLIYDDKKNLLIIRTENKIVANELSLRVNSLIRALKKRNIKINKTVIQ